MLATNNFHFSHQRYGKTRRGKWRGFSQLNARFSEAREGGGGEERLRQGLIASLVIRSTRVDALNLYLIQLLVKRVRVNSPGMTLTNELSFHELFESRVAEFGYTKNTACRSEAENEHPSRFLTNAFQSTSQNINGFYKGGPGRMNRSK